MLKITRRGMTTLLLCLGICFADPTKAVTFDKLLEYLNLGVAEPKLVALVEGSSTHFTLSPEQVSRLKAAGATDGLIKAISARSMAKTANADVGDFVLILDCSNSMNEKAANGSGTKFEAAKNAAYELIDSIPDGKQLSVIIYGHDAARKCEAVDVLYPLSQVDGSGKQQIRTLIAQLKAVGHTPIANSLKLARQELSKSPSSSAVILLTDGMETCHADPLAEAAALVQAEGNSSVNIVGLGLNEKERNAVAKIAKAGKGRYFDAAGVEELKASVKSVQREVVKAVLHDESSIIDNTPSRLLGSNLKKFDQSSVDRPAQLEPGMIGQVEVEQNSSAYFAMKCAGSSDHLIVVDTKKENWTNLMGKISILDEDGVELQVTSMNVIDNQFRWVVRGVKPSSDGMIRVRITNTSTSARFWVASAPNPALPESLTTKHLTEYDPRNPGAIPVPFMGLTLPKIIQPGAEIRGQLDELGSAYYIGRLPQGEYRIVSELTNASGAHTNIQGYLAMLDGDGGDQTKLVGFNEIDVTSRKSGSFKLKEPSMVIFRIATSGPAKKYTLRLRPIGG